MSNDEKGTTKKVLEIRPQGQRVPAPNESSQPRTANGRLLYEIGYSTDDAETIEHLKDFYDA